jgi:glycosyltransferase involved in cell wall biosynthesis
LKPPRSKILGTLKQLLVERWNYGGYRWVSGIVCQTPEQLEAVPIRSSIVIPNSSQPPGLVQFSWPRPYVAWIANLKAAKRPEMCIGLARQLLPCGIDLVMVGRIVDPKYQWLDQPAKTSANLHYLGSRSPEEVNGILARSLALVHTCMPEGYPNIFIQAWQQGIPTVSLEFDPGGIIEKHGLGYVSGGDEQQFHRDVLKIVADAKLARQIGQSAKHYAREHCAPKGNIAKLEAFLAEIIDENQRCTDSV